MQTALFLGLGRLGLHSLSGTWFLNVGLHFWMLASSILAEGSFENVTLNKKLEFMELFS